LPVGTQGKVLCLLEHEDDELAALLMMKRGCMVVCAGYKEQELKLIGRFSCGQDVGVFRISSPNELSFLAAREGANAMVSGQSLRSYEHINTACTVLRPLIGYSEHEIEDVRRRFSS